CNDCYVIAQNIQTGEIEYRIKDYPPRALIVIDGKITDKAVEDIDVRIIQYVNILDKKTAIEYFGEKGRNGVIDITTKSSKEYIPEKKSPKNSESSSDVYNREELFFEGGSMPEFPGGEKALNEFIQENIRYPEIARENGIQGNVLVTFIIDKEGKVKNPEVSLCVDQSLDEEALRVVETLPKWTPGKIKGEAVNVLYTTSVKFVLQ
ncbi:MAG: TonB family protein, partial [Prolixibacteraceae bacterium]|nr:TonB family protein [Prolixibacteraceae bacterium]